MVGDTEVGVSDEKSTPNPRDCVGSLYKARRRSTIESWNNANSEAAFQLRFRIPFCLRNLA
jgi:hypothetical protein